MALHQDPLSLADETPLAACNRPVTVVQCTPLSYNKCVLKMLLTALVRLVCACTQAATVVRQLYTV
jgi:hypothetical protein